MALEDLLTLPLSVGRDLLAQPEQPPADPSVYDAASQFNQQQDSFQRDLPQFFRDVFANLQQYQSVKQLQDEQFAQQQAAQAAASRAQQAQESELIQAAPPVTPPPPSLPPSVAINPRTGQPNPVLTGEAHPLPIPVLSEKSAGGFFGKLRHLATTITAPVGHGIEAGIEEAGRGIEHLPGGKTVGTAIENLPKAAAMFKQTFGEEFQKQTGQPLTLETSLDALNQYGFNPYVAKIQQGVEAVTHRTIDPVLVATVGQLSPHVAKRMTQVVDMAAGFAPYVVMTALAPETIPLDAALGTTFALSGMDNVKNVTGAYLNGHIDGRTFLLGFGLNAAMVAAPIAGPVLGKAISAFRNRGELEVAIDQINTAHATPADERLRAFTKDWSPAEQAIAERVIAHQPEPSSEILPPGRINLPGEVPENVPPNVPENIPSETRLPAEANIPKIVQQNAYAAVVERPDGTYDVYDKRYAGVPGTTEAGVTRGANAAEAIRNYKTADEALTASEDLAVSGAASPEVKRAKFAEEAGQKLEEGQAVQEAQQSTSSVIRQAGEVAAQRESDQRVADLLSEGVKRDEQQRVLGQAERISAHAQADETRFRGLVDDTHSNAGATVNVDTGKPVPNEGFFVGGSGAKTLTVPLEDFTPSVAAKFVTDNAQTFDHPNTHLGTEVVTVDGKKMVNIDASTQTTDRETALGLAKNRGEQRIWSTADKGYIEVPGVEQKQISVAKKVPVEEGAIRPSDEAKVGTAIHQWASKAGEVYDKIVTVIRDTLKRVLKSSELGALRIGRRTDISGITHEDLMTYGAARRWLHPEETWKDWSAHMSEKIGGSPDYWMSNARADVRTFIEKQMGLIGEGKQGGGTTLRTTKGEVVAPRFGTETKPSTYTDLVKFAEDGATLSAGDMRKWYNKFYSWAQKNFGEDADVFTMLAAVTQANTSPQGGVTAALRGYIQWKLGESISGMPSQSISKAMEQVIRGGVPQGPKINPFWEALRFSGERGRNAVAIDRWMLAALGGQEASWKRLAGNEKFIRLAQTIIRSAADEAGVSPRAFQAAVWGGFKTNWNAIREAAGMKPIGAPAATFESLFEAKMKEFSMRVPKDFRLLEDRQQMFDVDWLNQETAKALELAKPGETRIQRYARLNELAYNEWNNKIAAAHLLDTGEVPTHITSPDVRVATEQTAQAYRRAFRERTDAADTKTLQAMSKKGRLPDWQQREVDGTIARREASQEAVVERVHALPADEQRRLETLGFASRPAAIEDVTRAQTAMDELRGIKTLDKLTNWLHRNQDLVGDPAQYVGRKLKTGATYTDLSGAIVEKTTFSPYWEPRSFYENTRVLNIDRIKSEILSRFPDPRQVDGTSRNAADALGITKKELFGPCAAV